MYNTFIQLKLLDGASVFVRVADARRDGELPAEIAHDTPVSRTLCSQYKHFTISVRLQLRFS